MNEVDSLAVMNGGSGSSGGSGHVKKSARKSANPRLRQPQQTIERRTETPVPAPAAVQITQMSQQEREPDDPFLAPQSQQSQSHWGDEGMTTTTVADENLMLPAPPPPQQPQQYQPPPAAAVQQQPVVAVATAPAVTGPAVSVDRVNGIGMWRSWTRSFNTPLLALLDLFDNAVDASMKKLPSSSVPAAAAAHNGRFMMNLMAAINPGFYSNVQQQNGQRPYHHPKIVVTVDEIGGSGVMIRNSCESPIPPMKQVLEVYKSCKKNDAIGENGIGVKHACANLSTLSILLSKTTTNGQAVVSIGIVMEELQKPEGVVLPSMFFNGNENIYHVLQTQCFNFPHTWAVAFREYGEGTVESGLERIVKHINCTMIDQVWQQYDHVFTTLITKLRHRGRGEHHDDGFDHMNHGENEMHYEQADNNQLRSTILLKELHEKLPELYIHIHSIDVSVQHVPISKLFWEKRLVEITQFDIPINPKILWSKDPDAFDFENVPAAFQLNSLHRPKENKCVRFIVGFDPYRCKEKKQASCRVYLYSRESGRLIRDYADARSMLNLIAGSTDFTQGLTVIIDDFYSTLPLNPTKQDLAFGYTEHGQTHNTNLFEWTGAVTDFVWKYHFERLGLKKSALTTAVLKSIDNLESIFGRGQQQQQQQVPPIASATYTRFKDLDWSKLNGKIRVSGRSRKMATPIVGRDSLVKLPLPPPPPPRAPPVGVPPNGLMQPQQGWMQPQGFHAPPSQAPKQASRKAVSGSQQQLVASMQNRFNSLLHAPRNDNSNYDEDYVEDGEVRSTKRARLGGIANLKTEGGSSIVAQHPGRQSDFDDLKEQLREKDVIISKLVEEKNAESKRRLDFQQERNALEEKIDTLQCEKQDLELKLSSGSPGTLSSGSAGEVQKWKKKYNKLNGNFQRMMQKFSQKEAKENGKKASPNTPATTPSKSSVAVKEESSDTAVASAAMPQSPLPSSAPTSAAGTPSSHAAGMSVEEELRQIKLKYAKQKQVSKKYFDRSQQLEKRISSLQNDRQTLEDENANLKRQLDQRDEDQDDSDLLGASASVSASDDLEDDSPAVAEAVAAAANAVQNVADAAGVGVDSAAAAPDDVDVSPVLADRSQNNELDDIPFFEL